MRTSESTANLDEVLAKAQGELKNPNKTKVGKIKGVTKAGKAYEYEYKYADIADGIDIVRPVLSKHEISVIQGTRIEGGCVILETRLAHKGEWIESDYPVGRADLSHQDLGGCMTYARRYSLFPMLNIAAEEDKDGEGVTSGAPDPVVKAAPKPNAAQEWADAAAKSFKTFETEQERSNWIVTNEPMLDKLRKEHAGIAARLDEIITPERLGD